MNRSKKEFEYTREIQETLDDVEIGHEFEVYPDPRETLKKIMEGPKNYTI
ncbi:MAG: hypothetical protein QXG44_12270 [Candidatus Jordarchaeaceae archaeon]